MMAADALSKINEMSGVADDKPTTRTGRNLHLTMHQMPQASPNVQQAFELAAKCTVCKRSLIWLKGSRICACELGHTHSYPNLTPLGGW